MPVPIGDFISSTMYDGKLISDHPIVSPQSCCFVDVSEGREELRGTSWIVGTFPTWIFLSI